MLFQDKCKVCKQACRVAWDANMLQSLSGSCVPAAMPGRPAAGGSQLQERKGQHPGQEHLPRCNFAFEPSACLADRHSCACVAMLLSLFAPQAHQRRTSCAWGNGASCLKAKPSAFKRRHAQMTWRDRWLVIRCSFPLATSTGCFTSASGPPCADGPRLLAAKRPVECKASTDGAHEPWNGS